MNTSKTLHMETTGVPAVKTIAEITSRLAPQRGFR